MNDLLVVDRRRLLFGKECHGPRSAAAIFEDLDRFTPDLTLTIVDLSKIVPRQIVSCERGQFNSVENDPFCQGNSWTKDQVPFGAVSA